MKTTDFNKTVMKRIAKRVRGQARLLPPDPPTEMEIEVMLDNVYNMIIEEIGRTVPDSYIDEFYKALSEMLRME